MLLLFLACAPSDELPPLAEIDVRMVESGRWSLAEGAVLEQGAAGLVLEHGGRVRLLAAEVLGTPAQSDDGRRLVVSHRDDGLTISALDVVEISADGITQRRLVSEGSPDRAAISEDGEWVAFVSGQTGVASVWAVPFDGGAPQQLTNIGLEDAPRVPGGPPPGFVPPPHDGSLSVQGDEVWWVSPVGQHRVWLP
ncbi:MAG: hypothetical protein ACI8S6_002841 [Myxococcota bacterium]|jgi:hypothetical protein